MAHRKSNIGSNTRCCLAGMLRCAGLGFMLTILTLSGQAQVLPSPGFQLQSDDMAVLASRQRRADFSCQVTPYRPSLGFDLRFHADYRVKLPIGVLADIGPWLQVVMRVTPAANGEKPVYLSHRYPVSDVPLQTKGEGEFTGGFDLGPGHYQVDWMMRDSRGRVCSSHWKLEGMLPGGQQDLPLTLGPSLAAARLENPFDEEPPIERTTTGQLHVKILLNLSPVGAQESVLRSGDAAVLLSMLRSIAREPRVGRFTLLAFNLREQKIVDRQENAGKIDFGQLGRALQSRTAGTLDYHLLQDPLSETHFTTKLLTEQLGAAADSPDAIIIIGPKVTLEKRVPLDLLKQAGTAACPIFYLNYIPNPFDDPWRDTIGSAVKAYRNAVTHDILAPRDLGSAMRDILARIGKRPAAETPIGSL
jgi:hypothetical protein